ncbi:hypothetical protein KCU88_g2787, partial [Aureobasidium melanogenum]
MRSRIAAITAKGAEITRRLDYGYYNLLETVGSLVAIITGFQSLSKQSEQLIVNFDKETRRLDADTNKRVNSFKAAFEARDRKTQALAERGQKANAKAEELSLRLENARLVIQNWEKREDQVRKVWGRVVGVVWWTSITVVALVVLVVLGKEGWFRGDPVKAGLGAHSEGSWNASLQLDGSEGSVGARNERLLLMQDDDQHHSSYVHKGKEPVSVSNSASVESAPASPESVPKVPEDVRRLLLDIAEKNRRRKVKFPARIEMELKTQHNYSSDMANTTLPPRRARESIMQSQQLDFHFRSQRHCSYHFLSLTHSPFPKQLSETSVGNWKRKAKIHD